MGNNSRKPPASEKNPNPDYKPPIGNRNRPSGSSPLPTGGGTVERIKVYANIVDGRTVCICHAGKKGCGKKCSQEVVTRDKYSEWEKTFHRNRYGK